VEHTSRDSPQFNGKVERKTAVITRRIKSALNAARLTEDLRKALWGEAAMNLTDMYCCREATPSQPTLPSLKENFKV